MQIVILNGGKGTRVKSVSKNKPKCMINFNKKPSSKKVTIKSGK